MINLFYEPFPQAMSVETLNRTSTYQSPSQFVDFIPAQMDSLGYFEGRILLGDQPGLYHINFWVTLESQKPQAGNIIVWVQGS